jgi:hypothetical protein
VVPVKENDCQACILEGEELYWIKKYAAVETEKEKCFEVSEADASIDVRAVVVLNKRTFTILMIQPHLRQCEHLAGLYFSCYFSQFFFSV